MLIATPCNNRRTVGRGVSVGSCRGCITTSLETERIYIRAITARVQLKKSMVVGLEGLDAKTN
jgi:hypothetical protein